MAISIVTSMRVVSFSIIMIFINCLFRAARISHIDSFQFSNNKIRGVSLGCLNENIAQGVSYSASNINISDCFFSRTSQYAGNGGVISVASGVYTMYVNNSMFYNCISQRGGAIYFWSSKSYLKMICANSCSASMWYHLAYIIASHNNQMEYLSASNCSFTTSISYSIFMQAGNQSFDNTNCSMNNANEFSGVIFNFPSILTSSYCTFSNNKVLDSVCIYFYTDSDTISMSYANIVHNNSPTKFGVVCVEGTGSRKMMYCIFQNNQNYLFCVLSGSLEVSHSFIDHSALLSTSIAVSTATNNTFTNRMTYQLQFFNSLHCNTDNPQKTNDPNGIKSDSLILYFAIGLIIILIVIISYNFGRQRIHNSSQITAP